MKIGWVGLLALLIASSTARAEEVIVRPETAPGPLDNPLKGWCPYTDANPIGLPYSMVFQYASWKDLEPVEGQFAFEAWERRAWSVPEARGKHVVFRIYVDYPGKPSGLPDWLKAKGVKLTPYREHGGGLAPDYDDPQMRSAMTRLIAAMGQRYDRDPRLAFVQLGLLGFWGEWHTWPQGKLYASQETERQVIDAYHRAFPHKILMARSARDDAGTRPWIGYHDDMFPEDTDNGQDWSFLATIRRSGRSENWTRAAIGGEMVPLGAKTWLGDHYAQTLKMIERGHFSWIGPYGPPLELAPTAEFKTRSAALVRHLGYQFTLKEIRHPASLKASDRLALTIVGENEGVAPFYYPWSVEVALIDLKGAVKARLPLPVDVRTWRPGSFRVNEVVTMQAPPGRYRLGLGIIDPGTGRPAIAFANALPRLEGWTILSTINVEAGR